MRLATLARKIQMNPTRLISFLEDQGIKLDGGSNTKLDTETVDLVLIKFAPELIVIEPETPEKDEVEESNENISSESQPSNEPEAKPFKKEWSNELELIPDQPDKEVDPLTNQVSAKSEEVKDDIELIKAPKIILPGLKIKGKIELPEHPKKPEADREQKVEERLKKNPTNQRREIGNRNLKRKERDPDYNPLEEARKRAAREKEKKKIQEAKRKKEKRRERYEKEIQSKIKTQAPKKMSEHVTEEIFTKQPEVNPPRNIFSRFLRWLNT